MKVKIDTREKFYAITIEEPSLSANMTADLGNCLIPLLQNVVKSIVLILRDTKNIDNAAAEYLVKTQQLFYDNNASFVICELQPQVEKYLDEIQLLETMNTTPTLSEASDIILMEEIERELMDEE